MVIADIVIADIDIAIIDIALAGRYDSPEAFARAFKKLIGQTPSEFRKQPIAGWEAAFAILAEIRSSHMKQDDAGRQVTVVAAVSLVALVWMMHVVDDRGAFMYRGGFFLTALLSALVVL